MADDKGEVWVQLYIGNDKSRDAFRVKANRNIIIDDLKTAVYQAKDKSLGHCNAADLAVYKAGTDVPPKEDDKLDPGDAVSTHTTKNSSKHPLRVVAPASAVASAHQDTHRLIDTDFKIDSQELKNTPSI
jgi:Crinkler effector protein N-terminal domain